MSEQAKQGEPGKASPNTSATPLNDVMIAMDVVDTLRHDERIAMRELDDDARRAELIERLRDLYKGQGIEVPNRILEEGVKALAEERFVYDPPADDWRRALAQIYVTRGGWGRWVLGAIAGALIVMTAWYVMVARPQALEAERLPAALKAATAQIVSEAKDPAIAKRAQRLRDDGLQAAAQGARGKAARAERSLGAMASELRQEYKIKIVQRKGQLSGLWRIPKVNPSARNYYLIVEALRADGTLVKRNVVNEETGKRETVKTWAIRVPKSVLDKVQADKSDDGIIQDAVIGEKRRGVLEPKWFVDVSGGALTRW